jgi:hypothetical protein
MAVSHHFTGERVEDGSGEKADPDREEHDIEHPITSEERGLCRS